MANKTLNVKKTSRKELAEKWGFQPLMYPHKDYFIRCNAKGEVNWHKAPIYTPEELIDRNNVNIL